MPDKNWDLPTLAGAGAIRSTADDLLKFLQACVTDDKQPMTKAIRLAFEKRHTMKDGMAIGLGLAYRTRRNHPLAQRHDGRVLVVDFGRARC